MESPSHQTSKHHGERGAQRKRQQFNPWTVGAEEKDVIRFMPCPGGVGLGRPAPPSPASATPQHGEPGLKTSRESLLTAAAG